MKKWDELSESRKKEAISIYQEIGINDENLMRNHWNNTYADGGSLDNPKRKKLINNTGDNRDYIVMNGMRDEYGNIIPVKNLNPVTVTAPMPSYIKSLSPEERENYARGEAYAQDFSRRHNETGMKFLPLTMGAALAPVGAPFMNTMNRIFSNPLVDIAFTTHGAIKAPENIRQGINQINEGETAKGIGNLGLTALDVLGAGNLLNKAKVLKNDPLFDAYTNLNGRFGYYGNPFTRVYQTIARNNDLPFTAKTPELIRKMHEYNLDDNGKVIFSSNRVWKNPQTNETIKITNFTTDRPVIPHGNNSWDEFDAYIMNPDELKPYYHNELKSIEPMDTFVAGKDLIVKSKNKNATLVSGNTELLKKAEKEGLGTLSSKKLREIYPMLPEKKEEYTKEIQKLINKRGNPTLKDYEVLEKNTNLKTGVSQKNNFYDWLNNIDMEHTIFTYPNGRKIAYSPSVKDRESNHIKHRDWNKVFYDPTPDIEMNWRLSKGFKEKNK